MNKLAIITGAVDLVTGVENITNQVTTQAKAIMTIVFGAIALFCLGFTVVKGVRMGFQYHSHQQVDSAGPVIASAIGTIVAGLASSASFFGWFGL